MQTLEPIETYIPFLKKKAQILLNTAPAWLDVDDLASMGWPGLKKAYETWEEGKVPFESFAQQCIYWAILDGIRSAHWAPKDVYNKLKAEGREQEDLVQMITVEHIEIEEQTSPLYEKLEFEDFFAYLSMHLSPRDALWARQLMVEERTGREVAAAAEVSPSRVANILNSRIRPAMIERYEMVMSN